MYGKIKTQKNSTDHRFQGFEQLSRHPAKQATNLETGSRSSPRSNTDLRSDTRSQGILPPPATSQLNSQMDPLQVPGQTLPINANSVRLEHGTFLVTPPGSTNPTGDCLQEQFFFCECLPLEDCTSDALPLAVVVLLEVFVY